VHHHRAAFHAPRIATLGVRPGHTSERPELPWAQRSPAQSSTFAESNIHEPPHDGASIWPSPATLHHAETGRLRRGVHRQSAPARTAHELLSRAVVWIPHAAPAAPSAGLAPSRECERNGRRRSPLGRTLAIAQIQQLAMLRASAGRIPDQQRWTRSASAPLPRAVRISISSACPRSRYGAKATSSRATRSPGASSEPPTPRATARSTRVAGTRISSSRRRCSSAHGRSSPGRKPRRAVKSATSDGPHPRAQSFCATAASARWIASSAASRSIQALCGSSRWISPRPQHLAAEHRSQAGEQRAQGGVGACGGAPWPQRLD